MSIDTAKIRCRWCVGHSLMEAYHDTEWGVPLHDDRKLFEFIILDGFQAGLSWRTIIMKRQNFEKAFDHFDAAKIAGYNEKKLAALMQDAGIIRNKLKIHGAVKNAKAFLVVQKEFGSFDRYIWELAGGKPLVNQRKTMQDIPASTPVSDAMSKALQKRGFTFVGTTICYAFMQAAGMVNDHTMDCFRYKEVMK